MKIEIRKAPGCGFWKWSLYINGTFIENHITKREAREAGEALVGFMLWEG